MSGNLPPDTPPTIRATSLMVGDFPPHDRPVMRATSLIAGNFPANALVPAHSLFREDLPQIEKDAMTPGTLLVWAPHPDDAPEEPKAAQLHGAIAQAQGILHSALPEDFAHAEVTAGHVAMWIKPAGAQDGPEVGEAGGQGVKTMDLKPGHWVAYQPTDQELGNAAANVMRTWTESEQLVYSKPRAVAVLPRTLAFGTGSAEELEATRPQARNDANTPTPSFASAGTFCSEIAASAVHSASAALERYPALDVVPSRTSPSALHAALERSESFQPIGIIRVDLPPVPEGDEGNTRRTRN